MFALSSWKRISQLLREAARSLEERGLFSPEDRARAHALIGQAEQALKGGNPERFGAWAMSLGSGYRDVFARKGRWPDPASQGHRGTGRAAVAEHLSRARHRASLDGL